MCILLFVSTLFITHTHTHTHNSNIFTPCMTCLFSVLYRDRPYSAKHMPYAKYFQIATVKPNGRPANRTVVFRGFLGEMKTLLCPGGGKGRAAKHHSHTRETENLRTGELQAKLSAQNKTEHAITNHIPTLVRISRWMMDDDRT